MLSFLKNFNLQFPKVAILTCIRHALYVSAVCLYYKEMGGLVISLSCSDVLNDLKFAFMS